MEGRAMVYLPGRIASVVASVAVIAAACTTGRRPGQSQSSSACAGDMVLVVRNMTTRPLDIYASKTPDVGGVMIGTARPGLSEIIVPRGTGQYFSPRDAGAGSMLTPGSQLGGQSPIMMSTRCG
jgi:hypothetical protein